MPITQPTPSLGPVLDRLLADVLSGRYGPGERLPAERQLAVALGASRPTLREALRLLGEWRLLRVRRGSGVVVRPRADWSLGVLPAYVRVAIAEGPSSLARLLRDLLELRRGLFVHAVGMVATRLAPLDPAVRAEALAPARAAAERAWAARAELRRYVREDIGVLRALLEAATLWPALWLTNDVAEVYFALADTLGGGIPAAPPDYLEALETILGHLAAGEGEAATARLATYLLEHDQRLLTILGVPA